MSGDVHIQFCESLWGKFPWATHLVIGCTNKQAAERVWRELRDRLKKFGLEESETKSRLIEFGMKTYYKSVREGKKTKKREALFNGTCCVLKSRC